MALAVPAGSSGNVEGTLNTSSGFWADFAGDTFLVVSVFCGERDRGEPAVDSCTMALGLSGRQPIRESFSQAVKTEHTGKLRLCDQLDRLFHRVERDRQPAHLAINQLDSQTALSVREVPCSPMSLWPCCPDCADV